MCLKLTEPHNLLVNISYVPENMLAFNTEISPLTKLQLAVLVIRKAYLYSSLMYGLS